MAERVDFGPLAARYDDLRGGTGEAWHDVVELLVREGDLRGRRVLDVGCGTGRLAAALADRYGCKVWGVDVSPEMLEVAHGRVPAGVGLKLAAGEDLPFRDGWFERVTMTLVLHHLDASRALAEARRVLVPGGRLAILTFDPSQIERYYLNVYFPSLRAVDLRRFPPPGEVERDVRDAGFAGARLVRRDVHETISRTEALERIRGRHISTFQLIADEEYASGLERAERDLPEWIEYEQRWLVVVADA